MIHSTDEPALIASARIRDFEAVIDLLERGADPRTRSTEGWTALHCAALAGELEVVQWLLERGADPDAQAWETEASFDRPLHFAAANGRVEVVRLLIQYGADVSLRDRANHAPLAIARQRLQRNQKPAETEEIIRLLVQAGAEV